MEGLRRKHEPKVASAPTMTRRKKMARTLERHGLHYAKRLKEGLEAYNSKVASIQMRKDILEKQKQGDYQKEFENIRGILSKSTIPFETVERLRQRKAHLKARGARAVSID